MAKVKTGGHGFDMVVPSANFISIFIEEGLLLEARPDHFPNFKNVSAEWVKVTFEPGRKYTVPWQWGTTGLSVNKSVYSGDINTWDILFKTPVELKGKVKVLPEMNDVMMAATMYHGGEPCSGDKDLLRKVRDTLVAAKQDWQSIDYGGNGK